MFIPERNITPRAYKIRFLFFEKDMRNNRTHRASIKCRTRRVGKLLAHRFNEAILADRFGVHRIALSGITRLV